MNYWWLSFVRDEDFAGACIVPGESMFGAMVEAIDRGCHPAETEVSALALPAHKPPVPAEWVGVLLSRADVGRFDRAWRHSLH